VIGFDINGQRLVELRGGHDRTQETSPAELQAAALLEFTADPAALAAADVFVVTVPTPRISPTPMPALSRIGTARSNRSGRVSICRCTSTSRRSIRQVAGEKAASKGPGSGT
jgi:UDP-N-acetyl-D-mannosaminuronate dehydrogenase